MQYTFENLPDSFRLGENILGDVVNVIKGDDMLYWYDSDFEYSGKFNKEVIPHLIAMVNSGTMEVL